MDKLKKVGLTALGTALVSTAAYAGEMSVTGSAGLTFVGGDNTDTGNGWSQSDTLTFSGSADLDNGMTVTVSTAIDGGIMDANSLTIDTGGMGTIKFAGTDGSGPVGAWDDVTPSANEEAYALVAGTPTGPDGGTAGNNNWTYTNSEMMDGVTVMLHFQPSDSVAGATGELKSSTEYGIKYTGVEGLDVGFAAGDNESTTAVVENTVMYAKYAIDAFTIGVQDNSTDSETANADNDFRAYGISYAVNDDISISYNLAKTEYENTSLEDQEATGMSFSYTNGSMTFSGSMNEVDNIQGASATDNTGYELNISFAF